MLLQLLGAVIVVFFLFAEMHVYFIPASRTILLHSDFQNNT